MKPSSKKASQTICPITGLPAVYRDPLTGVPFANKDAFKIIREKFFQKDEEKLFIRLQVMNDLLTQKREKLKRLHSERAQLLETSTREETDQDMRLLSLNPFLRQKLLLDQSGLFSGWPAKRIKTQEGLSKARKTESTPDGLFKSSEEIRETAPV